MVLYRRPFIAVGELQSTASVPNIDRESEDEDDDGLLFQRCSFVYTCQLLCKGINEKKKKKDSKAVEFKRLLWLRLIPGFFFLFCYFELFLIDKKKGGWGWG